MYDQVRVPSSKPRNCCQDRSLETPGQSGNSEQTASLALPCYNSIYDTSRLTTSDAFDSIGVFGLLRAAFADKLTLVNLAAGGSLNRNTSRTRQFRLRNLDTKHKTRTPFRNTHKLISPDGTDTSRVSRTRRQYHGRRPHSRAIGW